MPEHRAAEQHVVEVGDDVVGVGLLRVARRHRVGDAGQTADGELDDQADGEQHRRGEVQLAAPHRERPVDDLHAGRDGDQHRADREHGNADRAEAAGEHVVGPHAPADEADRRAGEDDELVAEQRFAAEHRQHLADDAEAGQDEDVHLRMPEDPEQVLPQQWVGAGVDVEERAPRTRAGT